MWNKFLAAVALSGAVAIGCGMPGEAAGQSPAGGDELVGSAARLAGAWRGTGVGGHYHAVVFEQTPVAGSLRYTLDDFTCGFERRCLERHSVGTYRTAGGTVTLRDGAVDLRFAYRFEGDALVLTTADPRAAMQRVRLERVTSHCTEASACATQGLSQPRCPGAWTCSPRLACEYSCGSIPVSPGSVGAACSAPGECNAGLLCARRAGASDAVPGTCLPVAAVPGACGGPSHATCPTGERCVALFRNPDSVGYCHREARAGEACEGGDPRAPLCASGLSCVRAPGAAATAPGTCRAATDGGTDAGAPSCTTANDCTRPGVAQPRCPGSWACVRSACEYTCQSLPAPGALGGFCNGPSRLRCQAGLQCVLAFRSLDSPGVCHREARVGETCGGSAALAPVCADGLRCEFAPGAATGTPGVCRAPDVHIPDPPVACTTATDCTRPGVAQPRCPGSWACVNRSCQYTCQSL